MEKGWVQLESEIKELKTDFKRFENKIDNKIDAKIEGLNNKIDTKIEALDNKIADLNIKIDKLLQANNQK